jgi:hypothetical protein
MAVDMGRISGTSGASIDRLFVEPEGRADEDLLPNWVIKDVHDVVRAIPVPPTSAAFSNGRWFRPPRHNRSFYLRSPDGPGVIAIKGAEPLAPDFEESLDRVTSEIAVYQPSEPRRAAEHFASIERKVPCAVTLDEARAEALKALDIHRAHLSHYGELAHVPYPLAVLRHAPEVVRRVESQISARLPGSAMEHLEPNLRNGLGFLISYYPGLPTRTTMLNYVLPAASYHERAKELRRFVDPQEVVSRWTRLFARLLHLGFVPASVSSARTGNMCQPQNAALDGGFFDVDSAVRVEELPGPASVVEALEFSVRSLYHAVRTLLVERSYYHLETQGDVVDGWISCFIRARIRQSLTEESRAGLALAPSVKDFFNPDLAFDALAQKLEEFYPFKSLHSTRSDAREFILDNPWLLEPHRV